MTSGLEIIEVDGDVIRGTQMHGEIVDDMLHFFVNFDMYVYKPKEQADAMETLIHDTNVKGRWL